jgi:succinate dehydrogenase / fumarate reductase flavoprotein subunit
MSESLRNDGRIWVPRAKGDTRPPDQIPEDERDYYLERKYPSFGNLAPRDISSRAAKQVCDEGRGVGKTGLGVYLDFADAINRLGVGTIRERYGNLFDMYERITDEDPYKVPMRIYPAIHYTMGGLWVDYNLMSTIPACSCWARPTSPTTAPTARRQALMQGLADGYFISPYTVEHYWPRPNHRIKVTRSRGVSCTSEAVGRPPDPEALLRSRAERTVRHVPPRARQDHVDYCGHGPDRGRA